MHLIQNVSTESSSSSSSSSKRLLLNKIIVQNNRTKRINSNRQLEFVLVFLFSPLFESQLQPTNQPATTKKKSNIFWHANTQTDTEIECRRMKFFNSLIGILHIYFIFWNVSLALTLSLTLYNTIHSFINYIVIVLQFYFLFLFFSLHSVNSNQNQKICLFFFRFLGNKNIYIYY